MCLILVITGGKHRKHFKILTFAARKKFPTLLDHKCCPNKRKNNHRCSLIFFFFLPNTSHSCFTPKMRFSKNVWDPSIWARAVILLAVVSPDQLSLSLSLCLKCSLSNKNLVALLCLYAVFWLSSCFAAGDGRGEGRMENIPSYFLFFWSGLSVFRILWKCNKNIFEKIDNLSTVNQITKNWGEQICWGGGVGSWQFIWTI